MVKFIVATSGRDYSQGVHVRNIARVVAKDDEDKLLCGILPGSSISPTAILSHHQ